VKKDTPKGETMSSIDWIAGLGIPLMLVVIYNLHVIHGTLEVNGRRYFKFAI
jgi:hypothetical protein